MRPLMATHLEPVAAAGDAILLYDATRQVSLLPTGEPAAAHARLETATRIASEDPDEDVPPGYETFTKVATEDPDESPGWQ